MEPVEESIKVLASWDEIDIAFALFYQFLTDLSKYNVHDNVHDITDNSIHDITDNSIHDNVHDNPRVYHVVFSFGTVIRIDATDTNVHNKPSNLTPEYMESWPIYLLSDMKTDEVYKNASLVYDTQICLDGEEGAALKLAFDALIKHGYPTIFESPIVSHAGSDGDPPTTNLYSVEFSNGIDCTSNLVIDDIIPDQGDAIIYARMAADLRQLDYMFPYVYAVITPKNEIIKFV